MVYLGLAKNFFCLIWGDMDGSFSHAIIIDNLLHIGPWAKGHWGYNVWEDRHGFALTVH